MKLYLARHGEYVVNDNHHEGTLSESGKKDIQALTDFLKNQHIHVATIFHSGKLRAKQTAELLATGMHSDQPVQSRLGLNPTDDIDMLVDELNAGQEDALLVGHLPFMGKLMSKLVTGKENKDVAVFHPGTIVCLEKIIDQHWVIHWIINPHLLI